MNTDPGNLDALSARKPNVLPCQVIQQLPSLRLSLCATPKRKPPCLTSPKSVDRLLLSLSLSLSLREKMTSLQILLPLHSQAGIAEVLLT